MWARGVSSTQGFVLLVGFMWPRERSSTRTLQVTCFRDQNPALLCEWSDVNWWILYMETPKDLPLRCWFTNAYKWESKIMTPHGFLRLVWFDHIWFDLVPFSSPYLFLFFSRFWYPLSLSNGFPFPWFTAPGRLISWYIERHSISYYGRHRESRDIYLGLSSLADSRRVLLAFCAANRVSCSLYTMPLHHLPQFNLDSAKFLHVN